MTKGVNVAIGQQLGNYRLTRLLGKGAFAEVYLGEHIYLNNLAAIKEQKKMEQALRLGGAQWWFWMVRGHVNEGRQFLERVLTAAGSIVPSARAKALYAAGLLAFNQNDYQQAQPWYAARQVRNGIYA